MCLGDLGMSLWLFFPNSFHVYTIGWIVICLKPWMMNGKGGNIYPIPLPIRCDVYECVTLSWRINHTGGSDFSRTHCRFWVSCLEYFSTGKGGNLVIPKIPGLYYWNRWEWSISRIQSAPHGLMVWYSAFTRMLQTWHERVVEASPFQYW